MHGQMMQRPLLVRDILRYAEDAHRDAGLCSVTPQGRVRHSYPEMAARARRLAKGLARLGLSAGDRIATLAWNGHRHMELYYAVPGIGAICHTVNPRLSADQMRYILNHAGDAALFFDLDFLPLVEGLGVHLPEGIRLVAMCAATDMPQCALKLECYEALIEAEDDGFDWPDWPEDQAAGLCYTSGTTGNPKGALYSHRSQVLHGMMCALAMPDAMRAGRRLLPVVPLFHANAWGMAHAAPLTGASLVMPGARLDGASLWDLMDDEEVFSAWGVPTVWLGLMAECDKRGGLPEGLGEVVIGGSAAPPRMIAWFEDRDVSVCHAWGMTEMSPIGTVGHLRPSKDNAPRDERLALKARQGRRIFGVEMKIVAEDGAALPNDGKAAGELYVRGPAIISGYFANEEASAAAMDAEGWFGTGDVASIDAEGYLTIHDRSKDLIKSGGEWISSIDVENMAMSHPCIANCAVIAMPDEKWGERPLLVAVAAPGQQPDSASVLSHLADTLAKWQVPDTVEWVETLPLTATGKVSKLDLRRRFAPGG